MNWFPIDLAEPEHFPLDGGLEELGGVGDPDFLHHVRAVSLDGFDADFQPLGDFLVLEAGPDQLQDFLFTDREGFRSSFTRGRCRLRRRSVSRPLAHFGRCRHVRLAPLRINAIP